MKKLTPIFFFIVTTALFACNNANDVKQENNKPVISNKGVNISYIDTGKGDTTLLFVHGWCINKMYWKSQVDFFGPHYRVVAMDMPGFGESGKNRDVWTTEEYGRDVDSVIAQLHLKNVVLIGHSMAGDIVVQAAVGMPADVVGVIGVDNFKGVGAVPTKAEKDNYDTAMNMLRHNFTAVATQYFNESLFSKTTAENIKQRILNDVKRCDSVIAVKTMLDQSFEEVPKLKAANKKLYLINSDVTPTDTTGFVKNNIPFQVLYVHGTGHYPMIESPAEFNARLQEILGDINQSAK